MDLFEAAILAAYMRKAEHGSDVALLVRLDAGNVPDVPVAWSVDSRRTPYDYRSAIVTAVQGQADVGFDPANYAIFTTATPTTMDLGICVRGHVAAIYFLDGGRLRSINPATGVETVRPLSDAAMARPVGLGLDLGGIADLLEDLEARRLSARVREHWRLLMERPGMRAAYHRTPQYRVRQRAAYPDVPPPVVGIDGVFSARRDAIYMSIAASLVAIREIHENNGRAADYAGNNIGAILVGSDGRILAWGVNTNARNATLHAEINCVQEYQDATGGAALPHGARLYTTLQSCEMCAGMLATTSLPGLTVIYAERDYGLRPTALQRGANNSIERLCDGFPLRAQARARWSALGSVLLPAVRTFGGTAVQAALQTNDERQQARAQFVNAQRGAMQASITAAVQQNGALAPRRGAAMARAAGRATHLGGIRAGIVDALRARIVQAYRQQGVSRVADMLATPAATRLFQHALVGNIIFGLVANVLQRYPDDWTAGDIAAYLQGLALLAATIDG